MPASDTAMDNKANGRAAFQEQCLAAHNELRKEHGCPPLRWSSDLADSAQSWADKLADRGRVLYSEMPGVGENIAICTNNGPTTPLSTPDDSDPDQGTVDGARVVNYWLKERDQYDFAKGGWQRRTHNFTQMIWKSSVELGVAKSTTKDGKSTLVVAFYKPAGNCNKEGDFAKNVPKMVDSS